MQGICQLHNQDGRAEELAEKQDVWMKEDMDSEMDVLNNLMHESDVSQFPGEHFGCCH